MGERGPNRKIMGGCDVRKGRKQSEGRIGEHIWKERERGGRKKMFG